MTVQRNGPGEPSAQLAATSACVYMLGGGRIGVADCEGVVGDEVFVWGQLGAGMGDRRHEPGSVSENADGGEYSGRGIGDFMTAG